MQKSILKNRAFLFMWLGSAVSELGGAFGTFCNSVIVYQLTGSNLALSSMWLLYFIPSLILQLLIGPFIDRWSRKWIMILSQWTRGFIFLIPLFSLFFGHMAPWHIFVIQTIIGLITPFYVPANKAITPTVVRKEELQAANAYLDGLVRLMTFIAPLLGGIVIEYLGLKVTLSLVCLLLLSSGSMLLFVQERREVVKIRNRWIDDFREGITFFLNQRTIVWLSIFLAFVQLGVGVTMVINLPYITKVLDGSYAEYGYFMAGFPLGYVIGSFFIGHLSRKGTRLFMLSSLFVGGFTYISLGLNELILLAITTEVIAGMAMSFFNVENTSLCQRLVPNELLGKIFSVRLFITRGATPLGVFAGGLISESMGIRPLFITIGCMICFVSVVGITSPYFRFIDKSLSDQSA